MCSEMFGRNHSGIQGVVRKQLEAEREYLRQWPELLDALRRHKWNAAAKRLRKMHART